MRRACINIIIMNCFWYHFWTKFQDLKCISRQKTEIPHKAHKSFQLTRHSALKEEFLTLFKSLLNSGLQRTSSPYMQAHCLLLESWSQGQKTWQDSVVSSVQSCRCIYCDEPRAIFLLLLHCTLGSGVQQTNQVESSFWDYLWALQEVMLFSQLQSTSSDQWTTQAHQCYKCYLKWLDNSKDTAEHRATHLVTSICSRIFISSNYNLP